MRASGLREHGHRFFGPSPCSRCPGAHAIEIDDPEDLELACALAPFVDGPEPIDVDAVITDFDGVHTDDRGYVDSDGREMVLVSRSDGMGIALLRRPGSRCWSCRPSTTRSWPPAPASWASPCCRGSPTSAPCCATG